MVRDQGISKAGNRRARGSGRTGLDLVAQPAREQAIAVVPHTRWRLGGASVIVAPARKLIVALWHFLEAGVIPEGAKTNA